MPSDGRRLHAFTVISRALRLGRQLIIPAVVGGASFGDDLGSVLFWGVLILSLPALAIALAQWLVFRFRLADDELILDSGVLARRRRVIPVDRIQNVDIEQSPLERLTRTAALRIETASGGRDTEASLTVLAVAEARALREELLARRRSARGGEPLAPAVPDGQPGHDPEPLLRLGSVDLAVAGATSNEAGLIAAGLATLLELTGRVGALDRLTRGLDDVFRTGAALGAAGVGLAVLALGLAFLVLGWLVSIVTTVVRFHGFTLTRDDDNLRREYGLLSRHHTTAPLARVQAVRIEETLLRRAFRLAALKIETAGTGPLDRQTRPGGAEAYVPITRRTAVGGLLRQVFEDARFEGLRFEPVAPRSRRREFVRLAAFVLLATAGLAALVAPGFAALLLLLAPAWLLATARYRARGWARCDGYVLVRSGVLTRTTWVIPERKIQTLHILESPFQRRWQLATLVVDTAAGGREAAVVDLHQTIARRLLLELARDAEASRTLDRTRPSPYPPPPGGPGEDRRHSRQVDHG